MEFEICWLWNVWVFGFFWMAYTRAFCLAIKLGPLHIGIWRKWE